MLYLRTSRIAELEGDPDVAATWFADEEPLDLGTAWHGLHMLLTGSPWGGTPPLSDAVLGGTPLGDPSDREPVRFVSSDQVVAVSGALPMAAALVPRFTHRAMRQGEVYPESAWDREDALTGFLLPAYDELVALFAAAAAAGEAVLITLDRD